MNSRRSRLVWRELLVQRPLDETTALECIRRIADSPDAPLVALELRAAAGQTKLLLGALPAALEQLKQAFRAEFADAKPHREAVMTCRTVQPVPPYLPFAQDSLEHIVAGVYMALSRTRNDETVAVQLVLGGRLPVRSRMADVALWLVGGTTPDAKPVQLKPAEMKRFYAAIRIGARAATTSRRKQLVYGVYGALKRAESPEVHVRLKPARPEVFDEARLPWRGVPLSIREATAFAGLPIGEELAGIAPLHPKPLAPSVTLVAPKPHELVVAEATAHGAAGLLTIDTDAVLRGIHLLGPMGSGKSDAIAQFVIQWITQGKTCAVFEPKEDLCNAIAARVPDEYRDRIVYIDLFAKGGVIGFNPLKLGGRPPELVVDELVTIFATVLSDVLGVTTRDLLHNALLSLVHYPDATLLMLMPLLTDPAFRKQVVANVSDDVFLTAYWAEFEAKSEQAQAQLVSPVLTRLRQILTRKMFRDVLGQAHPQFDVRQVFNHEKRILLVPLPKAKLGEEGVKLFGSLMLHAVFGAINERAAVPPAKRHPVMVVVDEWHHFIHGSENFSEALTLFRGYGAGFVLANQVLKGQIPEKLQGIVLGAVRSRVYFQLGYDDAQTVTRGVPELDAIDVMRLKQFHVYAALHQRGATQPFVSGKTIKLPEPIGEVSDIRAASTERYGTPRKVVKAAIAELFGSSNAVDASEPVIGRIGRRPTTKNQEKGDES